MVRPFFFLRMLKIITFIFIVISLLSFGASAIRAETFEDGSASIRASSDITGFDYRVENLRNFLAKYNSPLSEYAPDFVREADENGLDYRLVASISGVESTFGKRIPSNSYNAYGWFKGDYNFKSWADSINVVSTTLRNKYVDKGAASINRIARRYAPPSTTWAGNVKFFVGKIDTLPLTFDI